MLYAFSLNFFPGLQFFSNTSAKKINKSMVFVFKRVRFGVAWGFVSRGGKFDDGLSIDGHGTPHCHQRKSQVQRSSGKEGFGVKKSLYQHGKH